MKQELILALTLFALPLQPAYALFGSGEKELKQELNERITTLTRGQENLINQLQQMQQEVSDLRGKIEVLTYQQDQQKQRQQDFYVDLDNRLRKLEPVSEAMPNDTAAQNSEKFLDNSHVSSGNAASEYEAALNQLKAGKPGQALTAFEKFIKQYPDSTLMSTAYFWAANSASQVKNTSKAINYFEVVMRKWPNDAIVPDAMLGLADSYSTAGEAKKATQTLQNLVKRYPKSQAAKIAQQRLS